MAHLYTIHPQHPQGRQVSKVASAIKEGALAAVPTDSAYALCGHLGDATLLDRIRSLRGVDERHHFTLMCRDLSDIGTYARVNNTIYRLLKAVTPGSYTFILNGSRELSRRILHPKRKTIGLRIPAYKTTLAILNALQQPMLSSTFIPAGSESAIANPADIPKSALKQIDIVIDTGDHHAPNVTTVVDLTGPSPEVIRHGIGSISALGL